MIIDLKSVGLSRIIWILSGLLVVIVAVVLIVHYAHTFTVRFTTPYQAVLFTNGSVYFGHLQDYGSADPVLTDMYYVVSQTEPNIKQVKSLLIKRGKEMHEPDRMYLNPSQIVFVE